MEYIKSSCRVCRVGGSRCCLLLIWYVEVEVDGVGGLVGWWAGVSGHGLVVWYSCLKKEGGKDWVFLGGGGGFDSAVGVSSGFGGRE